MKNLRILLIAGGVLLMGVSVFFLGQQVFESQQRFHGSVIGTPAPQAMDFSLQQPDGTPFHLAEQRGKVVLIYLGYTNCPDFCPATMGKYSQIREELGPDADQVAFVFITVDPERDSPEAIAAYMDRFDPSFIGLTGSPEELQKVWNGYGVGTPYRQEVESALGYVIAHSTRIWVIDQEGDLRITFPFEMSAADMTHDVQLLLAELAN
jgi:protein SCO1/2